MELLRRLVERRNLTRLDEFFLVFHVVDAYGGRLKGIVAETGSVLSHLAILAREAGVATVVGYANATRELHEGSTVTVDGETGRVTVEEEGT